VVRNALKFSLFITRNIADKRLSRIARNDVVFFDPSFKQF